MKKILTLLILLYGHLYALERESTLKIYHELFSALSSKKVINVYTNDKEYRDVFKHSKIIFLSNKPELSDIVLITEKRTLNRVLKVINFNHAADKKPIIFVTNYYLLKISDAIVGAMYWRKGRPQILFIKNRLDKYNIKLPRQYLKHMIDEL